MKHIYLLLFVICVACQDEIDNPEDSAIFYCALNQAEMQPVLSGDTISGFVGDTLHIQLNTTGTLLNVVSTAFTVESEGGGRYVCPLEKRQLNGILFKFQDQAGYESLYVQVRIREYAFMILENSYTVQAEGDTMRYWPDLFTYSPLALSTYQLAYDYYSVDEQKGSGSLECQTQGMDNRVYTGTFTQDRQQINMQYADREWDFELQSSGTASYLRQDLTEIFRQAYPDDTIHEVVILSKIIQL